MDNGEGGMHGSRTVPSHHGQVARNLKNNYSPGLLKRQEIEADIITEWPGKPVLLAILLQPSPPLSSSKHSGSGDRDEGLGTGGCPTHSPKPERPTTGQSYHVEHDQVLTVGWH